MSNLVDTRVPHDYPGAEFVAPGLRALEAGEPTLEAALLATHRDEFEAVGFHVPEWLPSESPDVVLSQRIAEWWPGGNVVGHTASLDRRMSKFARTFALLGP